MIASRTIPQWEGVSHSCNQIPKLQGFFKKILKRLIVDKFSWSNFKKFILHRCAKISKHNLTRQIFYLSEFQFIETSTSREVTQMLAQNIFYECNLK